MYFTVFRRYEAEESWRIPKATIFAYLIQPSIHSFIETCPGPEVASFMSSMIVDPSLLQEPSPEKKARFQIAMKALQLTPVICKEQFTATFPTSVRCTNPTSLRYPCAKRETAGRCMSITFAIRQTNFRRLEFHRLAKAHGACLW